jgi:hypothetical protein
MESSLSSIQRIRQETGLPVRFRFYFSVFVAETFLWFGRAVDQESIEGNQFAAGEGHQAGGPAAITMWHYFKSAKCYTRSLANSTRAGMLILKR